jgi:hypothetical protein
MASTSHDDTRSGGTRGNQLLTSTIALVLSALLAAEGRRSSTCDRWWRSTCSSGSR